MEGSNNFRTVRTHENRNHFFSKQAVCFEKKPYRSQAERFLYQGTIVQKISLRFLKKWFIFYGFLLYGMDNWSIGA